MEASPPKTPAPARRRRWLKIVLLTPVLILVAAALATFALIKGAEPQLTGDLVLQAGASSGPGHLQAPVRIERDPHGIPTIIADSLNDATFALGFVHAQDRLWQMETHRRIGAGRLAEVFGEAALDNDRFLRAVGIRRAAQVQWERLAPASRELLQAYAAGVNEAIARTRVWPPEFLLLGARPEPWTPVDSLSWSLMMAWDLGGNWTTEMLRLRLSAALEVSRIDQVLPAYPGDEHPPTRDYAALYRELGLAPADAARTASAMPTPLDSAWQALIDAAPPSGIEGSGSNNWVLAGSRTTTGAPLLANDPHLGLSAPALWYFARLKTPGLEVSGATMPGLPLVVLGQTDAVAWGFTNTGPDVQDLYIEAIDPQDPQRYRTPSGTAAFETSEEIIRVKGAADQRFTARRTRHGPVISDAGTLKGLNLGPYALALRWTALDEDVDLMAAGLALMKARNVAEFIQGSQRWTAPMQSMVVADTQGRIGMVAAGRVPVRRADNDLMGLAPAPGWESRYDWVGWVPAHQTPRVIDPEQGWIATANHRLHDDDYPHYLGSDWALPYRQLRIEQVLDSRPQHSAQDLSALQQDELSLAARAMLPWLRQARGSHALSASAQQRLATFDGHMRGADAAPLILWAWQRALAKQLLAPRIGAERFERSFAQRSFHDTVLGILEQQDSWWCDDPSTPDTETCAQQNGRALDAALQELSERLGPEIGLWRWDTVHRMVAEHRPFSRVKPLDAWFTLSLPIGGDTYTVHALRVGLGGPAAQRYRATHGPSLKAVYDLGDRSQSRFIHSSGQSGLPWQAGYRSWLEDWAQGKGVPVWPRPQDQGQLQVLTLRPAAVRP
jgi:penicillin amidase